MILRFKKLHLNAELPAYSTAGSAGLDVKACLDEPMVIEGGKWVMVPTGLSVELPENWELQVRSRSGLTARSGVFVMNGVGTIDADYRGEVKVILYNAGAAPFTVQHGDRVAQFVAGPFPRMIPMEVTNMTETERGLGGFGSTGV